MNILVKWEKNIYFTDLVPFCTKFRRAEGLNEHSGEKLLRIQTHFDQEMCMLNSENPKISLSRFQFMP